MWSPMMLFDELNFHPATQLIGMRDSSNFLMRFNTKMQLAESAKCRIEAITSDGQDIRVIGLIIARVTHLSPKIRLLRCIIDGTMAENIRQIGADAIEFNRRVVFANTVGLTISADDYCSFGYVFNPIDTDFVVPADIEADLCELRRILRGLFGLSCEMNGVIADEILGGATFDEIAANIERFAAKLGVRIVDEALFHAEFERKKMLHGSEDTKIYQDVFIGPHDGRHYRLWPARSKLDRFCAEVSLHIHMSGDWQVKENSRTA